MLEISSLTFLSTVLEAVIIFLNLNIFQQVVLSAFLRFNKIVEM